MVRISHPSISPDYGYLSHQALFGPVCIANLNPQEIYPAHCPKAVRIAAIPGCLMHARLSRFMTATYVMF